MIDSRPHAARRACVAILPARRAEKTIGATLESLRFGNAPFVGRVVVVTSAEDPTAEVVRAWACRDDRVELVALAAPASAGAARNAGRAHVARTGADETLLLFVDADCRLAAGGALGLAGELDATSAAAVSARVLGEGGLVARCRHILEFKEAASLHPAPPGWLPPSTTLLCRARDFDRAGGFPDFWPGEDLVFSQALRDLGESVVRSRAVVTIHRHPGGVVEMLRHQHRLGRTAARARRTRPMPGSWFAAGAWRAGLLLPARIVRIARWQLREGRAAAAWTLLLSPLLLAGLAAWTAGFAAASRRRRVRTGAVQPAWEIA